MVLELIPENRETTQKYESLACETIIDPAPIESVAKSFPVSESSPSAGSMGTTNEAAVIIATVDEPCAVFRMNAIRNGTASPNHVCSRNSPA